MSRAATAAMYEAKRVCRDDANKISDVNTKAIQEMSTKIDELITGIDAQSQNIDRLERAVSSLVNGIESQQRTMSAMVAQHSEFFRTTNKALDIIDRLAGR